MFEGDKTMYKNNQPISINSDTWEKLLTNNDITKEKDMVILRAVYESRGISATEVAIIVGESHYIRVNSQIGKFGKRIISKLSIQPPTKADGRPMYWHIPFLGYEGEGNRKGKFLWEMRPELVNVFKNF